MRTVVGSKTGETFRLEPRAVIGRGAEGTVYRARGGRCVKVFDAPLKNLDVQKMGALAALAKKAAGFAWPTGPVSDAATNDVVGFVMPLVAGKTLEALLDDRLTRTLSAETKIRIALAVAGAVASVHSLAGPRVALGDVLKAANIIVDGNTMTFVDTGSASLFGFRLQNGDPADSVSRLTTPGSVPPEVLGNPHALPSHAADKFALAVVLHEIILGHPPHEPKPGPAAVGLDPDDAVRRGLFFRYVTHPELEAPTYDPIEVPSEIDELFRAAFLSVAGRPSAEKWCEALQRWLDELQADAASTTDTDGIALNWVWIVAAFSVLAAVIMFSAIIVLIAFSKPPANPPATTPSTHSAPPPPVGPPQFNEVFR